MNTGEAMGLDSILSPYVVSTTIPLIILVLSAYVKKLARNATKWRQEDWYFGIELTLASMSAALIHITDIIKQGSRESWTADIINNLLLTTVFIPVTIIVLFVLMSRHRTWQDRLDSPKWKFINLAIISNFLGIVLMFTFIILVKRGIK